MGRWEEAGRRAYGDGIKPSLDEVEGAGETPGSVDDIELSKAVGEIVN